MIEEQAIGKIFGFITYLTDLVMSRGTEDYPNLVGQLPPEERNTYHDLLQCGIMFFLNFFMPGQEMTWTTINPSVSRLKREHFVKTYDETMDMHYFYLNADRKANLQ